MLGLVWSLEAAYLVWSLGGSPYLVCSLGRHLIWFGYLGDALSGLVTGEMPGLVSITQEARV